MKKLIAALLALAMLLPVLAVAEASNAAGVWRLAELRSGGQSYDPAGYDMRITIELRSGGSARLDSSLESAPQEGSWSADGDAVTIVDGNGNPMRFVLQGDQLVGEQDGVELVFNRDATAPTSEAPEGSGTPPVTQGDSGEFVPTLANAMKYTSGEWLASGYNRALLTLLMTFNVASDDVLSNPVLITDIMLNESYVGVPEGYSALIVAAYVDDFYIVISYNPYKKTASYTTFRMNVQVDGFLEKLVQETCGSTYYKNTQVDMMDALQFLDTL